jgi:hypothetical protein
MGADVELKIKAGGASYLLKTRREKGIRHKGIDNTYMVIMPWKENDIMTGKMLWDVKRDRLNSVRLAIECT